VDFQELGRLWKVVRVLIDEHYPDIQSYVERIHQKLAYQAALLKGGKYDYA